MARVLIVGCGGRGRALARELARAGHAVRGTTRDPARVEEIAAAGAEPYVGDPGRVGTLMNGLAGVTIVCHLLANVPGELHRTRLAMLLERLVDTPVRGFVYEAGGGAEAVQRAHATWNIPVALIEGEGADEGAWLAAARAAVAGLLDGGPPLD